MTKNTIKMAILTSTFRHNYAFCCSALKLWKLKIILYRILGTKNSHKPQILIWPRRFCCVPVWAAVVIPVHGREYTLQCSRRSPVSLVSHSLGLDNAPHPQLPALHLQLLSHSPPASKIIRKLCEKKTIFTLLVSVVNIITVTKMMAALSSNTYTTTSTSFYANKDDEHNDPDFNFIVRHPCCSWCTHIITLHYITDF